ncbi:hypothetical protein MPSEU_000979800 [Mayamaea pseudoterrestris]|nr:hypothetical protein MPSEU_000979800 [Mayamaea pseudoterrestris]
MNQTSKRMEPEGDTHALMSASITADDDSMCFIDELTIQQQAPPLVICTAVPYFMPSKNANFDEASSSLGSICIDAHAGTRHAIEQALFSLKTYQALCALAGLVVGSFIQLSSLGANYLLSELYNDGTNIASGYDMDLRGIDPQHRTAHVLGFSLLWSLLTALMGVMVLLILRSLVTLAAAGNQNSTAPSVSTLMRNLETYFAVGTLVGVCMSWTCTDVWMGLRAHSLQSLLTMAAALLWCKLVSRCCFSSNAVDDLTTSRPQSVSGEAHADEEADGYSPNQPLLLYNETDEQVFYNDEDDVCNSHPILLDLKLFKYESIFLGVLIGFYIQFSSLGANFLLGEFKSQESVTYLLLWAVDLSQNHKSALMFSLLWSAVTSGMGIAVLVFARSLVNITYKSRNGHVQNELVTSLLHDAMLQLECGFAVGALVGVNVSWVLTDLILDLRVQYLHSLLTFVLALVWCKSVSHCFIRSKAYHYDDEVLDEDYEEIMDDERPLLDHA